MQWEHSKPATDGKKEAEDKRHTVGSNKDLKMHIYNNVNQKRFSFKFNSTKGQIGTKVSVFILTSPLKLGSHWKNLSSLTLIQYHYSNNLLPVLKYFIPTQLLLKERKMKGSTCDTSAITLKPLTGPSELHSLSCHSCTCQGLGNISEQSVLEAEVSEAGWGKESGQLWQELSCEGWITGSDHLQSSRSSGCAMAIPNQKWSKEGQAVNQRQGHGALSHPTKQLLKHKFLKELMLVMTERCQCIAACSVWGCVAVDRS